MKNPIGVHQGKRVRVSQQLPLTPKEFDLLVFLASRPNRLVDRATLLREVWGHSAPVASRTVDPCPQHGGRKGVQPLAQQRRDDTGQHVSAAAGRHARIPCLVYVQLLAVRYDCALPF